jgi:hypothetical protein
MRCIIRRSGDFRTSMGAILAAVALVGSAATAPALAQDRDRNERGRSNVRAPQRHDTRAHHQPVRRPVYHRPAYGYDTPSYGYYPPPVVYAPPVPSAGINLIFPLNFR